jgi:hypothetical protein
MSYKAADPTDSDAGNVAGTALDSWWIKYWSISPPLSHCETNLMIPAYAPVANMSDRLYRLFVIALVHG